MPSGMASIASRSRLRAPDCEAQLIQATTAVTPMMAATMATMTPAMTTPETVRAVSTWARGVTTIPLIAVKCRKATATAPPEAVSSLRSSPGP